MSTNTSTYHSNDPTISDSALIFAYFKLELSRRRLDNSSPEVVEEGLRLEKLTQKIRFSKQNDVNAVTESSVFPNFRFSL